MSTPTRGVPSRQGAEKWSSVDSHNKGVGGLELGRLRSGTSSGFDVCKAVSAISQTREELDVR